MDRREVEKVVVEHGSDESEKYAEDTANASNAEARNDEQLQQNERNTDDEYSHFPIGSKSIEIEGREIEHCGSDGHCERETNAWLLEFVVDASDDEHNEDRA